MSEGDGAGALSDCGCRRKARVLDSSAETCSMFES